MSCKIKHPHEGYMQDPGDKVPKPVITAVKEVPKAEVFLSKEGMFKKDEVVKAPILKKKKKAKKARK